jgi:hypothetical protein
MSELAAWLLAAALHFSPVERLPQFPGHEETAESSRERYGAIAADVASVVEEMKGTKQEAALLLAWALGESGLARDADVGPCFRGRHKGANHRTRCDSGAAASMWQIHEHVAKDGTPVTKEQLFADRKLAARTMLRALRASSKACRHLKPEDRFSQAGLGRCVEGNKSVRARFRLWARVAGWAPTQGAAPAPKAGGPTS